MLIYLQHCRVDHYQPLGSIPDTDCLEWNTWCQNLHLQNSHIYIADWQNLMRMCTHINGILAVNYSRIIKITCNDNVAFKDGL